MTIDSVCGFSSAKIKNIFYFIFFFLGGGGRKTFIVWRMLLLLLLWIFSRTQQVLYDIYVDLINESVPMNYCVMCNARRLTYHRSSIHFFPRSYKSTNFFFFTPQSSLFFKNKRKCFSSLCPSCRPSCSDCRCNLSIGGQQSATGAPQLRSG